jgi:hypothetical protein
MGWNGRLDDAGAQPMQRHAAFMAVLPPSIDRETWDANDRLTILARSLATFIGILDSSIVNPPGNSGRAQRRRRDASVGCRRVQGDWTPPATDRDIAGRGR